MYHLISPEVAGGLGPNTAIDNSVFPPSVTFLEYRFDGWLGDDLLETFPCFIVTERLKNALTKINLTRYKFADLLVTTSDTFQTIYAGKGLPNFLLADSA